MCNVERTHAVNQVIGRGHIAPGTELVDLDTYRVNNVVDAVLHNRRAGPSHVHLDRESRGALEPIGRVSNATVFSQNAGAAHRATDNRHVVKTLACTTQRQVIGPVLRRNGIAKTHQRKILFFGKNVDGIQEVNPVRFARQVVRQRRGFCKIAVAVLAARKRARDCRACVHLREVCEVEAHVESFTRGYVECDFVAQDFFARGDGAAGVPAEGDGDRGVCA